MIPKILFTGRLNREYILPVEGQPILDRAGGSPLYAAGAAAIWTEGIAILARVGEDYPSRWLQQFKKYGIDVDGVKIVPGSVDLRAFRAYSPTRELSLSNPVRHFAQRELTFPKALLGYVPPEKREKVDAARHPSTPLVSDIPAPYQEAEALHLSPLDFKSQGQILTAFKAQPSVKYITLDPASQYMAPNRREDLRHFLDGLTAFMPSEEEIRQLFWGDTHDLWEMAEELGSFGCPFILIKRGNQGQLLYDADAKQRWELPAYSARVADPTGAGDAFCGGFIAGLTKTNDAVQAAAYGNVSASLSMEGSGPFYPTEVLPGLADARLNALMDLVQEV